MICPHCEKAGERSIVRIEKVDGVRPGSPNPRDRKPKEHFWDEDGIEHSHDPNVVRTDYLCSRGHRFYERSSWQCGSCGYMACKAEVVA